MSDARDQIVGLIAGSDERIRPIAERVADSILAKHAHELAEQIRNMDAGVIHMSGRRVSDIDVVADLIDPEVSNA
ncbi:hypothetical protein [Streptomyces sp. NPDC058542]|uniref:hypothetical protein n=1 Tax=Streptomyces sp. NPDC058542 TaxID=3346543 RepID=UPI0036533D96